MIHKGDDRICSREEKKIDLTLEKTHIRLLMLNGVSNFQKLILSIRHHRKQLNFMLNKIVI